MPRVLFLTGPSASGKTTLAQQLSLSLPASAHVEVELVRQMVVGGRTTPLDYDQPAFKQQWGLGIFNAASLVRHFVAFGLDVIVDDMIEAPHYDLYLKALEGLEADMQYVALTPSVGTLLKRDQERNEFERTGPWVVETHRLFQRRPDTRAISHDNSGETVEKSVDRLLEIWR